MYLFDVTCVCVSLRRCSNSHGCGVRSRRDFLFLPRLVYVLAAWARVCVCVGQAGGRVWCSCIIIHPPFPPLLETVWGPCGGWNGKGGRAREGLGGGEAEEKRALNEWHCLHGHACAAALSLSHAAWRGLNTRHLCSQRRSRPDPTAISVCIVPCDWILQLSRFIPPPLACFIILCALLPPSQCVFFHTALICRERMQIFVF